MRGSTKRLAAAVCCAALVAAACSGDDEPDATAPVPTADDEEASPTMEEAAGDAADDDEPGSSDAPDVEPDASAPPATDPPDTNAPPTDPPGTTAVAAPERRLPENLGPVTDSIPYPDAPGVEAPGEFYEIYDMGYVYLPLEDDPNDPTIVAPTDEELPIIAAYAEQESALAEQTFQSAVSDVPSERLRVIYVDQAEQLQREVLSRFANEGLRNEFLFDASDIYRPRVERPSTDGSAFVLDCQFISSATVDSNRQPLFNEISPYFQLGSRIELARVAGEWKVVDSESAEEVCG